MVFLICCIEKKWIIFKAVLSPHVWRIPITFGVRENRRTLYFRTEIYLITLSNTIFSPQYPLGDSCIVFRPEHESESKFAVSPPSVFEKIEFEKKCKFLTLNIFCIEMVIVIRLLVASNYSMNHLNMFKQRSNGKWHRKYTHFWRYLSIYFQN